MYMYLDKHSCVSLDTKDYVMILYHTLSIFFSNVDVFATGMNSTFLTILREKSLASSEIFHWFIETIPI